MNRILIIAGLISIACVSCKSKSKAVASTSTAKSTTEQQVYTLTLQDSLINFGKRYMHVPYRYGGTTSKGFDCSGFTSHVYKNFGYNLNRSSRDQATQFPSVQKRDLQTGDLVFFEGRRKNKTVGHVGIVTTPKPNGEFDFIHASVQNGVIISSSTESYYASRYLKAGRVINSSNTNAYARNVNFSSSGNLPSSTTQQVFEQKNIIDAIYHTVKRGDNLASISKKYDVPISTIQHLNNLSSKRIKRGQKLLITEAVNVPNMPIIEVPKIDYEKTVEGNDRNNFVLEQPKTNDINQPINNQNSTPGSQKLNPQEKFEVVVIDVKEPETSKSAVKTFNHKVEAGESLSSISRRYNMTIEDLKSQNNLTSNNINAGQILKVSSNDTAATSTENDLREQNSSKTVVHTVKSGDTLYSIARKYNCSVNDLRKWNSNLSDAIKIGDKIYIFE